MCLIMFSRSQLLNNIQGSVVREGIARQTVKGVTAEPRGKVWQKSTGGPLQSNGGVGKSLQRLSLGFYWAGDPES